MDQNYDRWEAADDALLARMVDATKYGTMINSRAWVGVGLVLAAKIFGQAIRDCAQALENALYDVEVTVYPPKGGE